MILPLHVEFGVVIVDAAGIQIATAESALDAAEIVHTMNAALETLKALGEVG